MGKLFYGGDSEPAEIPDRALAHVKAVISSKLRRGESFTLSWRHPDDAHGGRSTLWVSPSIPLRFVFTKPEGEILDPELLKRLATAAGSTGGLTIDLDDFREEPAAAVPKSSHLVSASR